MSLAFARIEKARKLVRGRRAGVGEKRINQVVADLAPFVRMDVKNGLTRFKNRVDPADLEKALRSRKWDRLMESIPWDDLSADLAKGEARLGKAAARVAGLTVGSLGGPAAELRYSPDNPRMAAYIASRTGELITVTRDGTLEAVRAAVTRQQKEGRTPRDVARDIRDSIGLNRPQARALDNFRRALERGRPGKVIPPTAPDQPAIRGPRQVLPADQIDSMVDRQAEAYLDYRAMMIARTETRLAANQGQIDVWTEALDQGILPPGSRQIWVVDGRPCSICLPMDGVPAPIGGTWTIRVPRSVRDGGGFAERKVTNPTQSHPHCLCTVQVEMP